MKRIISLVLTLSILGSMMTCTNFTVFADVIEENQLVDEKSINELYLEEFLSSYENKADVFNHTNYLAIHYTSDRVKNVIEYRINEDTNCNNLVEYLENDTWFNVAYSEWVLASLITDPVDTLNKSIHAETYYETVIFNIIDAAVTSENAIDWLNQGAIKNSVKILNSMTKYAETDYYAYLSNKNILISELTDEQYDKMMEFTTNYVNSQNFKIIGTDLSFLSDVLSMSKDIEEYSERLASYCQLFALGDEIAEFLEIIKNNADNDDYLKKAIDNIAPIIRDSYTSMLMTAAKEGVECIGEIALEKIVGDAWKNALIKLLNGGVLFDGTAIVNASFLALSVGKTITNIAFSVDKKMDQYELMRALCSFETAMEKSIYDILNNYQNTEAYSNLVLAGVSIVYQTYITDAEIYSEMVTICQKDWGSNLVEEELNRVLEISNHNKQIYQAEYDSLKPISGLCGDLLGWVITPDDELIIYGVGAMYDYEETTSPWYSYRNSIITVYLSSYVTTVGSFAFKDSSNICAPVVLMDNVTLNSNAFNNVAATIICKGDLKLNGNHTVNGLLYVEGALYGTQIIVEEKAKIFVGKQFTLDGTINASGNLYVYGELDVKGDFQANDLTNIFDYGVMNVGGNANFIATSRRFWDTIGYIYIYSDASFCVGGDLTLKGSWFNNVHTQWFILYLYGELIVEGNFSASNRFVALNQTTLDSLFVVKGDFYLSVLNQTWIGGFDVGCKGYECSFTAGTLILGGNYNNESTVAFKNSHTTVLNGVGKQTITGLNASNLTIANTSSSGVCFSGNSFVTGNLNSNTSKLVDGKIYISTEVR